MIKAAFSYRSLAHYYHGSTQADMVLEKNLESSTFGFIEGDRELGLVWAFETSKFPPVTLPPVRSYHLILLK